MLEFQEFRIWRDSGGARCHEGTNVAKLTQFLYNTIDLLRICSLWVGSGFGVFGAMSISPVNRDCRRGVKPSVFSILTPMTLEKIGPRGRELVATDESTIMAGPFLYTTMMEDGQRGGSLRPIQHR